MTLIGEENLPSISSQVKDAFRLAILADETTDKSIKSQLNVVVRYSKVDTLTNNVLVL